MSVFITFEGIEGCGKSTHLRHLAARLRADGFDVVETREPGDTEAGARLRPLLLGPDAPALVPLAELFLYCADRAQHVTEVIRPALAAGRIVLCDRFSDSTLAYQGYGRGLDLTLVRTLDGHARAGLTPDVTFLLDCDVATGLERARARHGTRDRFEGEHLAFHARVQEGFRTLARAEPDRFRVIDTTPSIHDVQRAIIAETAGRLGQAR